MPKTYKPSAVALFDACIEELKKCHEPSTQDQYRSGIKKFKKYLQDTCPELEFPLTELDWLLFGQWMKDVEGLAPGTIKNYQTHTAFVMECAGYDPPKWLEMPRVRRLRKRRKGLIEAKSKKKQPIDYGLGKRIVDMVPEDDPDANIFCSTLLVGIAGFFRLGELLIKKHTNIDEKRVIRAGHLQFFPHRRTPRHMTLFLPYSKVDKYGHGLTIIIPCHSEAKYCPVRRLAHATQFLKPTDPVFCWPNGTQITKSSFIKKLRRHLSDLGIDPKQFSGHSLRRGAAVSAKAAGAGEALIKLLGRWSSDAYKVYLNHIPMHVQRLNEMLLLMGIAQTG